MSYERNLQISILYFSFRTFLVELLQHLLSPLDAPLDDIHHVIDKETFYRVVDTDKGWSVIERSSHARHNYL